MFLLEEIVSRVRPALAPQAPTVRIIMGVVVVCGSFSVSVEMQRNKVRTILSMFSRTSIRWVWLMDVPASPIMNEVSKTRCVFIIQGFRAYLKLLVRR